MTGKKLQAIRHKLGLNTAQLAMLLRCSRRTVENWEQGRNTIPVDVELRLTGVCPCCGKPSPESQVAPETPADGVKQI